MSEDKVRVGVGVIVVRDGKVLLGLRKSEHGKGVWGFPGGHLEYGESPEECASRELEEETGMFVDPRYVRRGPYTNDVFEEARKHYVTIFVTCHIKEGVCPRVCEPDKCERWEWFSWDEMPENLFLPIVHLREEGYTPI